MGLGLSFGGALKSAADFQTSINNLGKVSDRPLAEMQTQLKSVSSSLGSYAQLAQGYYQILSAGVTDATASMDMLTASSMAAKAAQVTQADTIRALTSLMTGFTGGLQSGAYRRFLPQAPRRTREGNAAKSLQCANHRQAGPSLRHL